MAASIAGLDGSDFVISLAREAAVVVVVACDHQEIAG